MGGVAVLNLQDILKEPLCRKTLIFPTDMKKPRNANPNRSNRAQPNRRKRSPTRPNTAIRPPAPRRVVAQKATSKNFVTGQVKILKRGEKLSGRASDKNLEELDPRSTERMGPDPDSISTRIRLTTGSNEIAGFYAGSSAFVASPPPSSLPLPAFSMKKCVSVKNEDVASDLRRILRLD